MEQLCINCKINKIKVVKRGLCSSCYQRLWQSKKLESVDGSYSPISRWQVLHNAEIEFIKNFFNHKNWFYQPTAFRANGFRYEPDFYDGERNVFIEVIGTRQAFHTNKAKYHRFVKTFPHIKFEVRTASGELIDLNAEKQHIKNI